MGESLIRLLDGPEPSPTANGRERDPNLPWVIGVLIVIALVVTALGNEQRVQDWDPQYTKVVVDRTAAYGGTFYENGLFNKGPLELVLHQIGSVIMPEDGHWIWIALVSALLALVIAFAASRTARWAGASGPVSAVVGVFTFMHFTFSDADYSGVVYPRNIIVGLLALVWMLLLSERRWTTPNHRLVSTAIGAALIGLTVQTLLTSVFTAIVLLVAGFLLLRGRAPGWERMRLSGVAFVVGDIAFMSAAVWYATRGAFDEFWASWFTYARYMAVGTQASLGSQFGLGWDRFYEYHERVPLVLAVVLVFAATIAIGWRSWTRRRRILFVTVGAWWAMAWFEMILSQRYSSHYYSITAVPVTLMLALLIGLAHSALLPGRPRLAGRPWWPAAAALLAIFMLGPSNFGRALYTTMHFEGTAALDAAEDKYLDGNTRTSRAIMDLVSVEGDPLLAWTNEPWPYLKLERVSATRFPWKSFLIGEIYLGQTSKDYVLPQTWEWFFEDLEESQPVVLAEANWTLAEGNPFADHAHANFTPVYRGTPITVWLRNDLATSVLERRAGDLWAPPEPVAAGWTAAPGTATAAAGSEMLPIGASCMRIEGIVEFPPDALQILSFYFEDRTYATERLHLGVERGQAYSGSDFVTYEATTLGDAGIGRKEFTLIVGSRSAVLVMQGEIVAALRLPADVNVSVRVDAPTVTLADLRTGAAPAESGCPG